MATDCQVSCDDMVVGLVTAMSFDPAMGGAVVRRVTPAQLKSMVNKAQREARQAVDKYNSTVRQHNANVKRAVNNYNREVRAYNSRVRSNRRRLEAEISRLKRQRSTTQYVGTQTSTWQLQEAYIHVDEAATVGGWTDQSALLADLAEAETANSTRVVNTLVGEAEKGVDNRELAETCLTDELSSLSADLDQRWQGALFALSPHNPDAARHFCTSSREVVIQMLDLKAADRDVLATMPNCQKTKEGKPTRKAKIMYLLDRIGASEESLRAFIERGIDDVLELFSVFNSGAHMARPGSSTLVN